MYCHLSFLNIQLKVNVCFHRIAGNLKKVKNGIKNVSPHFSGQCIC